MNVESQVIWSVTKLIETILKNSSRKLYDFEEDKLILHRIQEKMKRQIEEEITLFMSLSSTLSLQILFSL